MINCSELSGRMPEMATRGLEWSPIEAAHLAECVECAAEWRLVRIGSTLHANLALDTERVVQRVLARLRTGGDVVAMPRLPWRNFALGLAAAASVALAVWVPNRAHQTVAMTLPSRIGVLLPSLSNVTDEQLNGIRLASEAHTAVGEPGAVPHLGDLTEDDLTQLSGMTENP
jgi:hypothetical protein